MRSSVRPSARPESPTPPPSAWPPSATFGHEPAGIVRPRASSAVYTFASRAPGPIWARPPETEIPSSPPTSTTTAVRLVELPSYAFPPERATSGTSNRFAQRTTARTSAAFLARTTAGGSIPSKRRLNSTRAAS